MEENLVEVEITAGTVTTSQYGTLSSGDKLRTSPEFARHLVKEAMAAKYTNEADDQDDTQAEKQAQAEGRRPMAASDEERNKRGGGTDPERQGAAAGKATGKGSK